MARLAGGAHADRLPVRWCRDCRITERDRASRSSQCLSALRGTPTAVVGRRPSQRQAGWLLALGAERPVPRHAL